VFFKKIVIIACCLLSLDYSCFDFSHIFHSWYCNDHCKSEINTGGMVNSFNELADTVGIMIAMSGMIQVLPQYHLHQKAIYRVQSLIRNFKKLVGFSFLFWLFSGLIMEFRLA